MLQQLFNSIIFLFINVLLYNQNNNKIKVKKNWTLPETLAPESWKFRCGRRDEEGKLGVISLKTHCFWPICLLRTLYRQLHHISWLFSLFFIFLKFLFLFFLGILGETTETETENFMGDTALYSPTSIPPLLIFENCFHFSSIPKSLSFV